MDTAGDYIVYRYKVETDEYGCMSIYFWRRESNFWVEEDQTKAIKYDLSDMQVCSNDSED